MPERTVGPFRDAVAVRGPGALRARLMLPQHTNALLFSKPGSLQRSVPQKAGLLLRAEEIFSGRSR
jgi:hypothetical protein